MSWLDWALVLIQYLADLLVFRLSNCSPFSSDCSGH